MNLCNWVLIWKYNPIFNNQFMFRILNDIGIFQLNCYCLLVKLCISKYPYHCVIILFFILLFYLYKNIEPGRLNHIMHLKHVMLSNSFRGSTLTWLTEPNMKKKHYMWYNQIGGKHFLFLFMNKPWYSSNNLLFHRDRFRYSQETNNKKRTPTYFRKRN